MTTTISYTNSTTKKNSSNHVLFIDEKFNIKSLKKFLSTLESTFIADIVKTKDIKKKILKFDISSKKESF